MATQWILSFLIFPFLWFCNSVHLMIAEFSFKNTHIIIFFNFKGSFLKRTFKYKVADVYIMGLGQPSKEKLDIKCETRDLFDRLSTSPINCCFHFSFHV